VSFFKVTRLSPRVTTSTYFKCSFPDITAGNWIEVAYGTASGAVCVIVQHPELVGQGFQLFQTFTVHRSPVTKVMLSEKHLVSGALFFVTFASLRADVLTSS